MLQPLDILLCLKLVTYEEEKPLPSLETIAQEIHISRANGYRSLNRVTQAGLVNADKRPRKDALFQLIAFAVRYVYYVKPGEPTRGVPTAHAAPPLSHLIGQSSDIPVWPDPQGDVRGQAVTPLHPEVPNVVRNDPKLYELLALVDAIRIGRARERNLAVEELSSRLGNQRE